jgi:GH15 family glucan-1,4-alpha-glucosidase
MIEHLETIWRQPDDGIWEVRGGLQLFVHSKVMWVTFDRAAQGIEQYGLPGPIEHWRQTRDAIHADVCAKGFNAHRQLHTKLWQ